MKKFKTVRKWTVYRGVNNRMFIQENMEDWLAMLKIIADGQPKFDIEVIVNEMEKP